MVSEFEKINCCGCGVCANICPQNCIKMAADEEGFLYPHIDKSACIGCNLCVKRCPIINNQKYNSQQEPIAYVVQVNDKTILKLSTSGGSFTILSKWIIEHNGVVFGASFNKYMKVEHIRAECIDDLYKFQGSKYVQSFTGNIYKHVKYILEKGRYVCFSGTPCQVAGLKSFLNKDYDNLFTVDVVCHGVPSPKFWEKYKLYYEKKFHSKLTSAAFRNKKFGYEHPTMYLEFENGKSINIFTMDDYFLSAFFSEICSRPSCHNCAFKFINRNSDFTIFDCWNVSKYSKTMTNKGATNIFIHTLKAKVLFDNIKDKFIFKEINYHDAIENDGIMVIKSTSPNPNRSKFFYDMDNLTIHELKDKYYPNSFSRKIKSKIRSFIVKCGIYKLIFRP